jgi:hypothetical protein
VEACCEGGQGSPRAVAPFDDDDDDDGDSVNNKFIFWYRKYGTHIYNVNKNDDDDDYGNKGIVIKGLPVSIAERSTSCTVYDSLNIEIAVSNPARGMDVFLYCVVLCFGRGLALD